jgi:hypothetical protein
VEAGKNVRLRSMSQGKWIMDCTISGPKIFFEHLLLGNWAVLAVYFKR